MPHLNGLSSQLWAHSLSRAQSLVASKPACPFCSISAFSRCRTAKRWLRHGNNDIVKLHTKLISTKHAASNLPRAPENATQYPLVLRQLYSTAFTEQKGDIFKQSEEGQCPDWERWALGKKAGFREETIYALSTAPGPSAIAIVRVSGPLCQQIYHSLCPSKPLPKPRVATVRALYLPQCSMKGREDGSKCIDPGALILYFPGPKSYTGQDMLELHVHGGVATVKAVLDAIPKCVPDVDNAAVSESEVESSSQTLPTPKTRHTPIARKDKQNKNKVTFQNPIRPANPGEFTQLAFYSGNLSLPQVESLSALLSATTEQARLAATRGSTGILTRQYDRWRELLVATIAECEALIDFSEDQGFEQSQDQFISNVRHGVATLIRQIGIARENAKRGELLRGGIKVSLLGKPNTGKSSLLNCVVGREAAIVSEEEGTTRDVVEVCLDLEGWLVRLGDTAGLRKARAARPGGRKQEKGQVFSSDPSARQIGLVEQEGIRRAKQQALDSDVVLVMLSLDSVSAINAIPDTAPDLENSVSCSLNTLIDPEIMQVVKQVHSLGRAVIFVLNKTDKFDPRLRDQLVNLCRDRIYEAFPEMFGPSGKFCTKEAGITSSAPGTAAPPIIPISCLEAEQATHPTDQKFSNLPQSLSPHLHPDPGGIHRLLSALTSAFSRLTSAVVLSNHTDGDAVDKGEAGRGLDINGKKQQPSTTVEDVRASEVALNSVPSAFWTEALGATSRQRLLLEECGSHLQDFLAVTERENLGAEETENVDIVIAVEHLRAAADCLARITGRAGGDGDVEDILGVVFEKFCVGK